MPPRRAEALPLQPAPPHPRRGRRRLRRARRCVDGVAQSLVADRLGGDTARARQIVRRSAKPAAPATPERLRRGSLLRHEFSPRYSASAAVLVDGKTGRVLWGRGARAAARRLDDEDHDRAPRAAEAAAARHRHRRQSVPRVPLVREGLRAGERVEAWKLFYSLLLYSGNDDALALAIAAGGDKWTFIRVDERRGEEARAPRHALLDPERRGDADNYSSAWDLAALTRVAMRNPRFRQIVQTRSST